MTESHLRPRLLILAAVTASAVVVGVASLVHRRVEEPASVVPTTSFDPAAFEVDPSSRFLVVGGGGDPDSSEVQLEHDTILARGTFRGPGTTLFAGGSGRFGVREDRGAHAISFRDAVGELFLPRARAARIRVPSFAPDGAATYENVTSTLDRLLSVAGEPLVVVVATHGEGGENPNDGYSLLWGNDGLFVHELDLIVDEPGHDRPSRFVIGSCHGGAFATALDRDARDASGAAKSCGFFATTADRLASGCDGDPQRSRHRSYLRSFLTALRDPRADTSGDSRVSMLEAHVAAAVSLESFDVPFTTAEALVRDASASLDDTAPHAAIHEDGDLHDPFAAPVAPAPAAADPSAASSPETERVASALGMRLGLTTLVAVEDAIEELRDRMDDADEALADLEASRDTAWNRLRVALLERFPWLEDAYAPGWEARLESHRGEIEPLLLRSDLAEALVLLDGQLAEAGAALDELRVREAMLTRLALALDFPRLLGLVRARYPDIAARYDAARACERFVPALAP